MKLIFGALLLLMMMSAIVWFGFWLWEFIESDSCFDMGGVWNYGTSTCEQSPSYDEWKKSRGRG